MTGAGRGISFPRRTEEIRGEIPVHLPAFQFAPERGPVRPVAGPFPILLGAERLFGGGT